MRQYDRYSSKLSKFPDSRSPFVGNDPRYLAQDLQQIEIHILEDVILPIDDLPSTVETLFKDISIESTIPFHIYD